MHTAAFLGIAAPSHRTHGDTETLPHRQEGRSSGRQPKEPTGTTDTAPETSGGGASARKVEEDTGGDGYDDGRATRSRTRARQQSEPAVPAATSAPSLQRTQAPPPRAGATTKSNPAPATLSGRPEPSASPAPGSVDDTIWDPASKIIVAAWLLSVSPGFLHSFGRGSHSISPSNASDARRATNRAASTWYMVSHATAAPSPVWVAASSRSSPRLGQSGRTTSGAGS